MSGFRSPFIEKIEESNKSKAERASETFEDLMTQIIIGTASFLEGVKDKALTTVGQVGGIFNREYEKEIEKRVAEHSRFVENAHLYQRSNLSGSYINEMGQGGQDLVRGVGQGVGNMIPALAVGQLGAGIGLSTKAAYFLSNAVFFAGSAGMATEQALNEGATFDQATTYGNLVGSVEVITERIFGGLTTNIFGKGVMDNVLRNVNKSKVAKLALDVFGEGAEEALSEFVNPLLQQITYNEDAEFWDDNHKQAILQAALIGGLTSIVYGKTLGTIQTGNQAILEVAQDISYLQKKVNKEFSRGLLKDSTINELNTSKKALSEKLGKMNDIERASIMKEFKLNDYFNEDGSIVEDNKINYEAVTPQARVGKLPDVNIAKNISEQQKSTLRLGAKIGYKMVVADDLKTSDGRVANGYYDPDTKTIVISSKNNNPNEVFVHEMTHTLEGTEQYAKFADFLLNESKTNELLKSKIKDLGIDLATIRKMYAGQGKTAQSKEYVALTEYIAYATSEVLFKDESTIKRMIDSQNKSTVQKIYNWIKQTIKRISNSQSMTKDERAYLNMLNKAEKMYAKAIESKAEGVKISEIDNIESIDNRYSIVTLDNGMQYVAADRQVFKGEKISFYPNQLLSYINTKVRKNGEWIIPTYEGQTILINRTSANKLSSVDQYYSKLEGKTVNINEKTYQTKLNAAIHSDELITVSSYKNKASDNGKHSSRSLNVDSWEYRRAYFKDYDGQYYELTLSIALNNEGNRLLYNINHITKKALPNFYGSKALSNASNAILQQTDEDVKTDEKKTTDTRYSVEDLRKESIRKALAGELNRGETVHLGFTPEFLIEMGFKQRPLSITVKHLLSSTDGSKHNVPISYYESLFNGSLNNPAFVINNNGIYVFVTTDFIDAGDPVIIPIKPDAKNAKINTITVDVNMILSVYGKRDIVTYINQNANNIIYWNKQKATEITSAAGLQLSRAVNSIATDIILQQVKNNVNNNRYSLTKDSLGNELTPDQKEYFKDSQIVDEHGNLLVMYHGTPFREFHSFKGDIFFFSKNREFAEDYANDKSFNNGMDADITIYEVYLKGKQLFDTRNKKQVESLVEKIDTENMTFGFNNKTYSKQEWIDAILGNVIDEPMWTSEQISNAKFGETIGDDKHGYNNDRFVGIDKDSNVVYVPGYYAEHLKYLDEKQVQDLLDGKSVQVKLVNNRFDAEAYKKAYGYEAASWDFVTHTINPYKTSQKSKRLTEQDNWTVLELTHDRETGKSVIDLLKEQGYDSIKLFENSEENYAVFKPNQIKETTNKNPTSDHDIRYSITDDTLVKKYTGLDLNQDISNLNEVPAIQLNDGSIVPSIEGLTHVQIIKNNNINVDDVNNGGWIYNGEYEAYESSDTLRYVRQEQAKKRFDEKTKNQRFALENTKVVDENGKPLLVHHGSPVTNIKQFDPTKGGTNTGVPEKLVYFTNDIKTAQVWSKEYKESNASQFIKEPTGKEGSVYSVYLNMQKPLDLRNLSSEDVSILVKMYQEELGLNEKMAKNLVDISKEANNNQLLKTAITKEQLQKHGYDGIIAHMFGKDKDIYEYGVLEPNQVIQDNQRFSLSKGQEAKKLANRTKPKKYSKKDAESVINTILDEYMMFSNIDGNLPTMNKEEAIEKLWIALNKNDEGERGTVALELAKYIIENAIAENIYTDVNNTDDIEYLSMVKGYKGYIDISTIKDEIKDYFGRDNSPLQVWGKRKNNEAVDIETVAAELKEMGINLDGKKPIDLFIDLHVKYKKAQNNMREQAKSLRAEISKSEYTNLKNNIVREVLNAWDNYGKETIISNEITKYQDLVGDLKIKLRDARSISFVVSKMFKTIDRVSGLEKYQSVEDIPLSQEIISAVKLLRKIKTWRGNLASADAVRGIFRKYSTKVADENGKKIPLYNLYHKMNNDGTFGDENPYAELIETIANGKGELKYNDFDAIDQILTNFIHNVKSYDRAFFEGQEQSMTDLVEKAISETIETVPVKQTKSGSYKRWIESPIWRFERLSNFKKDGYFYKMYRELHDGVSRQAEFKRDVAEHYKEFFKKHRKEVESWREQNIDFNGVKVSKGQLISLYMLSQREQAQTHLYNVDEGSGRIRVANEKLAKDHRTNDAVNQGKDVSILKGFIEGYEFNSIENEYIKLTEEFFNKMSKNAKTEIDVKLFGVTNVEDGKYFPIRVSDDVLYKQIGDAQSEFNNLFSVYGASFNKNVRRNAHNKVVIENVLDVVERHTQQMSAYYGLAIPIKTFNRVWNKKSDNTNLKSEVAAVDPTFQKYVGKLLKDIQGARAELSTFDRNFGKIRGWWARAALGLNPKVLTTQFASLWAAGGVGMKYKNLVKGLGKGLVGKTDYENLYKYSPMLYDRAREGNNVDVGLLKRDAGILGNVDKMTDLTTKPIGMIDNLVVGSVWNAALEQTKNEYKQFSEEHYRAAAKLTEEAVIKTQANWSPLYRPDILRTQSSLLQAVTMFTSEPLQVFSQIAGSIEKLKIAKQLGDEALIAEAKQEARHYAMSITLNAMFLTMVGMAFKWIKFGDEDDEKWWETALQELAGHFIGIFPIFRDFYSLWQGYELTNMYETGINNIYKGYESVSNIISNGIIGKEAYDWKDFKRDGRQLILGITQTFGVPLKNLETYIKGIFEKFNQSMVYRYEDNFYNQSYEKDLQKAIESGDDELADTIVEMMFRDKNVSVTDAKTKDLINELYQSGYSVMPRAVSKTIIIDDETVKLTQKQFKTFKTTYSEADSKISSMVKLRVFNSMDKEAQAKAIKYVYDYYYNSAKEGLTGEEYSGSFGAMANYVPVEQLAMIKAYKNTIDADVRNGNIVNGSKKLKVKMMLNSMGLTKQQKALIMEYLGYAQDYTTMSLEPFIRSQKVSQTQLEILLGYTE